MSYDYKKLWQPIKINNMRLRNRIMLSAMGTFTPMQDGTDSEEGIRYYEAVSYTHLTLPTKGHGCRSRWSPYH